MKSLLEFFGIKEGPYDDLNRQLGQAQSLRGGPRTEPSVRRNQDRASRWTPSTARAQSDMDSAQSVVKREAAGDVTVNLTSVEASILKGLVGEYHDGPERGQLLKKLEGSGEESGHPDSMLQMSPRLKP